LNDDALIEPGTIEPGGRAPHIGAMDEQPQPLRKRGHPHALAARERKRAEAAAIGLDPVYIDAFVETFYASIREDELLGPIFAARIADWGPHLARMKAFWRGVLLNSGEYTGNPMRMHVAIPGLEERHFAHWLELFYAALTSLDRQGEAARAVGAKARMIADSLLTGIEMQRGGGIAAMRSGDRLPHFAN